MILARCLFALIVGAATWQQYRVATSLNESTRLRFVLKVIWLLTLINGVALVIGLQSAIPEGCIVSFFAVLLVLPKILFVAGSSFSLLEFGVSGFLSIGKCRTFPARLFRAVVVVTLFGVLFGVLRLVVDLLYPPWGGVI